MASERSIQLSDLLDRWEKLSTAASQKVESASQPVQCSFYAGVLFGMSIARDELIEALAKEMIESTNLTGTLSSAEQSSN
jgi:hypothetical protein